MCAAGGGGRSQRVYTGAGSALITTEPSAADHLLQLGPRRSEPPVFVMEVLPAAGPPELDCNSNPLPAELEVKKLQELVRRLELQNEHLRALPSSPGFVLRSSSGGGGGGGGSFRPHGPPLALRSRSPPEEPFHYFQPHGAREPGEDAAEPSVLDELELLDLEVLCCPGVEEEEVEEQQETWLYVSSRAPEPGDDSLTPLQWCRQFLDRPKSEVEAARRSLSLRLEQVSRWRSSLSSPSSHSSPGPPLGRVAGRSPVGAPSCSTPLSSDRHAPSLSSPLHHVLHRTLSPVGKEPPPLAERIPTFLPHPAHPSRRLSSLCPPSSTDGVFGGPEDESIALGYKLHDLTDVQVMARLQEESLRQDYASTSSTLATRRSQSFTFQLSAGPGLEEEEDEEEEEEEEEEDDEDYGLLPPPQPRLTRLPHSHTFSSMRDWRRSTTSLSSPPSTPTTPPPPPSSAGFAFQPLAPPPPLQGQGSGGGAEPQGFRPGSDKLRRSMPNLVRAPSMPSVPIPTNPSASLCLLRNSLSFDSSSGRLASSIPSPGQLHSRVQSVGNFSSSSSRQQPLKATAYVSPTVKGSSGLQPPSAGGGGSGGWSNSGIPLFSKAAVGGGSPASTPGTPRSGLPRPASFVGATGSNPRSKGAPAARSLLMPPKTLSTFSPLRDGTWRDGCY